MIPVIKKKWSTIQRSNNNTITVNQSFVRYNAYNLNRKQWK
jgi:hypothetical protein